MAGLKRCPYITQVCVVPGLFLSIYFTIELIFDTIYKSYYTITANFFLYLQYFQ